VVSVRLVARARCAKDHLPGEPRQYVGVYIDVNMYYRTRGTADVPAARPIVPRSLLVLALLLVAACARTVSNPPPPGTEVPPFGIPGVFLTQGGNHMRTAPLTALLAGLAVGAPAAAQTPRQPTPRRSASPETFVAVLTG